MVRVVFIGRRISRADYHRLGINALRGRGWAVEVWDFSRLLGQRRVERSSSRVGLEDSDFIEVESRQQAKEWLIGLGYGDFVLDFDGILSYLRLDLLLSRDCMYGGVLLGLIPVQSITFFYLLRRLVLSPSGFLIKSATIFVGVLSRRFRRRPLDFLMVGGSMSNTDSRYCVDSKTRYVQAHALDYDRYLEMENSSQLVAPEKKYNYAVFLDQFVPYHPDYEDLKIKPYALAGDYYAQINRFFDEYEMFFGVTILIAAHPRADYDKYPVTFGHREIIHGKTIELVRNSSAVIAHASASLNYAVMYFKPIFLLTSDKYSPILTSRIAAFSDLLGARVIDVSGSMSTCFSDVNVSIRKYLDYKELYIKQAGTPNKYTWDIFADYILQDISKKSEMREVSLSEK